MAETPSFDKHFDELRDYADRNDVDFPHHFGLKLIQWRNEAVQRERARIANELRDSGLGDLTDAYATRLLALPTGKVKPVCAMCGAGRKVDPADPDRHLCLNQHPTRRAGTWCWCIQCNPEQTGPPETTTK